MDIDMDALDEAINKAFSTAPEQLATLLRRIRKALALAEDTRGDEATREVAKDTAARLMAQYGITAAMLADAGQVVDKVGNELFDVRAPYTYDKVNLLATVVRAYGGELIYTSKTAQLSQLRVYGMGSDLERIRMLWASLLVQLDNEMRQASAARTGGDRRDVFERSFLAGFTTEVGARIKAAEARAKDNAETERVDAGGGTGTSVALVLAGRQALVQAAVKEANPKLRKAASRSMKLSGSGLAAGAAAGRRADLGGGRLVSGSGSRSIGG